MYTVLKATTGRARAAVIAALVGLKHPRVVPMLGRILEDSDPLGDDLSVVLDTLAALAAFGDDRAVPQIAATARRRRWLAWRRTRRLREAAITTLVRMGSARARQSLTDLTRSDDFFLRRQAAAAVRRLPA
jgi:HEAT repeat protein